LASFPIFRDYEILFTDYTLSTPWYASVESLVHPCKQNINQQITNINCNKAENAMMKRSRQILIRLLQTGVFNLIGYILTPFVSDKRYHRL
jgi:hypothetical protein